MSTVEHTARFEIDQPADVLFPLFSAEGEKKWVPDWDYKNVMGTTELEEDYVFITENHDHGAEQAIWLTKTYDPDGYAVTFYKVEPGEKVGIISVRCIPLAEDQTRVIVTYKYISLSAAGRKFVADFTAAAYEDFIGEWKELLEIYFERR